MPAPHKASGPAGRAKAAPALPAPFALLKFAGDLVADALADEPRSLAVLVHGFTPGDETAGDPGGASGAWRARLARRPAFQKDVKAPFAEDRAPARPRESAWTSGRTLAEIEGANLVRWLTALPANKLSASAYRELLGTLARAARVGVRVAGRSRRCGS